MAVYWVKDYRINLYVSYNMTKIAANGTEVKQGTLICLNSGWYAEIAGPGDMIEGVVTETKEYPVDNESVYKFRVEYQPALLENTYSIKPNGPVTQDMVGKYFQITTDQQLDIATASPIQGEIRMESILSDVLVEIRIMRIKEIPPDMAMIEEYREYSDFPPVGLPNTFYIDQSKGLIYIWDGTAYMLVGGSGDTHLLLEGFQANYEYKKNTLIRYNNELYAAKDDFTSGSTRNPADWIEVNSAYIKNVTTQGFQANHDYVANEMIVYNGKLYSAKINFTSGSTFNEADWNEVNSAYLEQVTLQPFQPSHTYTANELIRYNGKMYFANTNFTSWATFNPADWTEADSTTLENVTIDPFQPSHTYVANEPITQGGYLYIANTNFVSGATFNPTDWTELSTNYVKHTQFQQAFTDIANRDKTYYLDPLYTGTTETGSLTQPYKSFPTLSATHGTETNVVVVCKNMDNYNLTISGVSGWLFEWETRIQNVTITNTATNIFIEDLVILSFNNAGQVILHAVIMNGPVVITWGETRFLIALFQNAVTQSGGNAYVDNSRFMGNYAYTTSAGNTYFNGCINLALHVSGTGSASCSWETSFKNNPSSPFSIISDSPSGNVNIYSGDSDAYPISLSQGTYSLGKFIYNPTWSVFTATEVLIGLNARQIYDPQTFQAVTPTSTRQRDINTAFDNLLQALKTEGFDIGGALTAGDIGAAPTQVDLFTYYVNDIRGTGGVIDTSAADARNRSYTIGGVTHQATEIFNNTWVRNTNPGNLNHRRVLTNTPGSNPQVYIFTDVWVDTVAEASPTLAGIMRLYSDLTANNTNGSVTQKAINDALANYAKLSSTQSFTWVNTFTNDLVVPTKSTLPVTPSSTTYATEAQVGNSIVDISGKVDITKTDTGVTSSILNNGTDVTIKSLDTNRSEVYSNPDTIVLWLISPGDIVRWAIMFIDIMDIDIMTKTNTPGYWSFYILQPIGTFPVAGMGGIWVYIYEGALNDVFQYLKRQGRERTRTHNGTYRSAWTELNVLPDFTRHTLTPASNTITLDYINQTVSVTSNATLNINNGAIMNEGYTYLQEVANGTWAVLTINLGANITNPFGLPLTIAAGKTAYISFMRRTSTTQLMDFRITA